MIYIFLDVQTLKNMLSIFAIEKNTHMYRQSSFLPCILTKGMYLIYLYEYKLQIKLVLHYLYLNNTTI